MGGNIENPEYKQVKSGKTGHVEVVKIEFDPDIISFEKLAKYFFEIHDPTQIDQQGIDYGTQYHSTIFYVGEEQKMILEKIIRLLEEQEEETAQNKIEVKTTLIDSNKFEFWTGEEYHQKYYLKNPDELKVHMCHEHKPKFIKEYTTTTTTIQDEL